MSMILEELDQMYQLLILIATAQAPLLSKPLENGINYKLC